ncbi:MAG: metallophosphoesterase [Candidatus Aenigmarchaeota archaeon]|nr:metallophosphoesterase [Candidatus Aenigmarchaeota archaeon]
MTIKFVANYPAAFITDKKLLVISDLHIGLETQLLHSGIKIHKQIEKFKEIIDKLIDLTNAKTLIILGDIKHKVPGAYFQELKDIPKFLEYLSAKVKVHVIKGNHDDGIKLMIPTGVKLHGSRGFKFGNYGFFHGHAWPSKKLLQCDYLFMGHLQPAIEFRDKLGYRSRQQSWLKIKLNQVAITNKYKIKKTGKLNLIITPAFNSLAGSLNVIGDKELTGPLLANNAIILEDAAVYLLDGTCLGDIKSLKKRFQKLLLTSA